MDISWILCKKLKFIDLKLFWEIIFLGFILPFGKRYFEQLEPPVNVKHFAKYPAIWCLACLSTVTISMILQAYLLKHMVGIFKHWWILIILVRGFVDSLTKKLLLIVFWTGLDRAIYEYFSFMGRWETGVCCWKHLYRGQKHDVKNKLLPRNISENI